MSESAPGFTKKELEHYLSVLNEELKKDDLTGEVCIVGDAALAVQCVPASARGVPARNRARLGSASWTREVIQLADSSFASPGVALRNYLLMSSPTPFRNRNLFIDEDSLSVA